MSDEQPKVVIFVMNYLVQTTDTREWINKVILLKNLLESLLAKTFQVNLYTKIITWQKTAIKEKIICLKMLLFVIHKLLSVCPVCSEKSRLLQPVLWKYGKKDYEVLRFVYGIHNDVLLVRRVYMCLRKHQFIAHDTGILKQSRNPIEEPSLLFNKTAITRDLHRFFLVHVNFGLSSHDILTLWYQPQCDEYRSRKLQLEKRYLISAEDKLVM